MKNTLDRLLEELKSKNIYQREQAIQKLGKLGSKKAIKPLEKLLGEEKRELRLKVVNSLNEIGGIEASRALIKALKDKDREIKKETINALGKIGDTSASGPLKKLLSDTTQNEFYIDIIEALGQIGDTMPLIEALNDANSDIAARAAGILGQLCARKAVPHLLKALKSSSWKVRATALESIGRMRCTEVTVKISSLIDDPNDNVRSELARALGKMEDERAVPYLIKALEDRHWDVRRNAAEGLGNSDSEDAIEPLIKALKDENSGVRNNSAEALGRVGNKKAIRPLIEALEDSEPNVRGNVAKSLGLLGYSEALEDLKKALNKEEDPWVKRYLDEAISYIHLEPEIEQKKRILMVDDDRFIIKLLRITLQEDYETISAYNGEEAVARAKIDSPHLILLDIMMPKMDGFEVVQALRMEKSTKDIPVVIVSAKSQEKDLEKIKKLGVAGYIRKPFNTIKLLQKVEEILQQNES